MHDNSMQAGNGKGSTASYNYTYIDKNGPTITSATANSNNTITVVASDNEGSGIKAYILTESNVAPRADDSNWSPNQTGQWTSLAKSPGTYYAWAKDAVGNITKESKLATIINPGKPDKEGYFTENSTVDGGKADSNNPTIPAGFKPYEQEGTEVGNTGTAHWTDANGKPSENSVRQGLVIESKDLGEFVWIPVPDINKMIMCQSKQANDQCIITKKDGQLYCTVHRSYDICGKLYNDVETSFNANKTDQIYAKDSGRREPDLVTDYDNDSEGYLRNIGLTAARFEEDMIADFKKMAVSTYDHGGFWMGRYQTSLYHTNNSTEYKDVMAQTKKNRWPLSP